MNYLLRPETAKKRKKRTPGTVRVVLVLLALFAQLFLLAYLAVLLREKTVYFYFLLEIAGAAVVTIMFTKSRHSSYNIVWLIIILVMPVFGYLLILLWGTTGLNLRKSRNILENIAYSQAFLKQDSLIYSEFLSQHPYRQRIGTYLRKEGFPIYQHTQCSYYPLGELEFTKLIEDMEQAQQYIFLEYFIIAEGQLWDRIHDLLRRKAQQGLEIRVLYDDLGSINKLSDTFVRELRGENIQVTKFNPIGLNIFGLFSNYRNHQKITVIDGNIGYTGGTNIADDNVNITHRLGHFKDAAVRLEGEAVWGLTVTFLQMWDSEFNPQSDYQRYLPTIHVEGSGFYQPFADGPVNDRNKPAEGIYSQIITGAQQYVYITSPYLVIDSAMKNILCMAAQGGVDVRILTPKIWDHWYVHMVTQSNYEDLIAAGVRIYEYTPGFLHAKIILSDDDSCVMGSINMDYRSFYLNFENGVWICGAPVLQDIKTDLMNILSISEEVSLEQWRTRPKYISIMQNILGIFAPLF